MGANGAASKDAECGVLGIMRMAVPQISFGQICNARKFQSRFYCERRANVEQVAVEPLGTNQNLKA